MKAVVLAAGEGVRLRPLTSTRSKHMLPIGGKPLLEHTLLSLKAAGIQEITLVIGYHGMKIKSYFDDGTTLGLRLTYIEQEHPLGTAKAISLAEHYVEGEDFLVVYGDLLLSPNVFTDILMRNRSGVGIAMGVVPVPNPSQFGVVQVEDGFVKAISEKPAEPVEGNLINAGVYIFPGDVFRDIKKTKMSQRGEFEITDTLQSFIRKGESIGAVFLSAKNWLDIGRPWDLLEANERVLSRTELRVQGVVEEGVHRVGPVGVEAGATIRSGAYLEGPVLVCKGSDVGPNCYLRPFTCLGRNVRVGNACEVKNSIVMNGTHIGHLSYVGDSVVGERCNLGAGTIFANLRFDDHFIKVSVKAQRIDSGLRKLGAFLGDDVKTGIGVLIMPGVSVGSKAWVGPGVVLRQDIEGGLFIQLKQEYISSMTKE